MSSRRDCLSLSETNSVARIFTRSSTSIARARKFSTGGGPHGYGRGRLVVIQAQRGRNFSRVPPRLPQQAAAPNTAEFPSRHENRNRFAWPRVLAAEGTEVVRGGSGVRRSSRGRGVELGGRELAALPPHSKYRAGGGCATFLEGVAQFVEFLWDNADRNGVTAVAAI